jgi:hypothetical protein
MKKWIIVFFLLFDISLSISQEDLIPYLVYKEEGKIKLHVNRNTNIGKAILEYVSKNQAYANFIDESEVNSADTQIINLSDLHPAIAQVLDLQECNLLNSNCAGVAYFLTGENDNEIPIQRTLWSLEKFAKNYYPLLPTDEPGAGDIIEMHFAIEQNDLSLNYFSFHYMVILDKTVNDKGKVQYTIFHKTGSLPENVAIFDIVTDFREYLTNFKQHYKSYGAMKVGMHRHGKSPNLHKQPQGSFITLEDYSLTYHHVKWPELMAQAATSGLFIPSHLETSQGCNLLSMPASFRSYR